MRGFVVRVHACDLHGHDRAPKFSDVHPTHLTHYNLPCVVVVSLSVLVRMEPVVVVASVVDVFDVGAVVVVGALVDDFVVGVVVVALVDAVVVVVVVAANYERNYSLLYQFFKCL